MSIPEKSLRPFDSRAALAVLGLVALGGLSACGKGEAKLPGDDVVLAKVKGEPVTEYDVTRAVDKALGPFALPSVEKATRKAAFESVLQSRAIVALASEEFGEIERLAIEKEVLAYRESLYVKEYLRRHAPSEAPSEAEIAAYYKQHAARYGAVETKAYELVGTTRAPAGAERVVAMKILSEAGKSKNWSEFVQSAAKEKLELVRTEGVLSDSVLDEKIREALTSVEEGQTSQLIFVQGRVFMGRVTGKRLASAKPLSEVHEQVKKAIELASVRDRIGKLGEEALSKVKIERIAVPEGVPAEKKP